MINSAQRAYIRRETAISMVINAVISAGFVWAVFGGRSSATVWGSGGVVADFVPQTFMVSLMSVLVPTLLTRKRLRSGQYSGMQLAPSRLPGNIGLRASVIALAATAVFAGIAAAILALSGIERLGFGPLATIKVLYGALVACVVTRFALDAAFRDSTSPGL